MRQVDACQKAIPLQCITTLDPDQPRKLSRSRRTAEGVRAVASAAAAWRTAAI